METKQQLPMTMEIASVLCAKRCSEDKAWAQKVESNPAQAFGPDFDAKNRIVTVKNTAGSLNICVPDYKMLNDGTLEQLADKQMADVSGGLLFLVIPAILAAALSVPAAIAGGVAGHYAGND
ncbi:MAG: hypothetical protein OXU50_05680 [Gammaproteobacteria bacterium]|nr:hypothetical protein [Gammaproteobacteria bacterium]MDD9885928.1 hypothetical protein [Gammaproteobacteria bacterium]